MRSISIHVVSSILEDAHNKLNIEINTESFDFSTNSLDNKNNSIVLVTVITIKDF